MSAARSAGVPENSRRSPSPALSGSVSPKRCKRMVMPTAFGSRPASLAILRSFSTPAAKRFRLSSGKAGLVGIGYQASPIFAVRRSAGPELAADPDRDAGLLRRLGREDDLVELT